jgi:hypothetical protein
LLDLYLEITPHAVRIGAYRKRETIMKHLKLIAAALAVIALSACVGVIVPIPVHGSTATQDADHNERR